MTSCRWCNAPIVNPHCDSPTCNWCRACYERKASDNRIAGDMGASSTCRVRWPSGVDVGAASRMLDHLDGLPVTEATSMPPGSICALCARDLHVFVHPKSIPGSRWSLMDGCPSCETHLRLSADPWEIPPLGTMPASSDYPSDGAK